MNKDNFGLRTSDFKKNSIYISPQEYRIWKTRGKLRN